ncbi:unnamed protein product [Paramecium pentaurelia]|uniref:non-specific serine/threonine protein kinase n=1 Tax=Paramecium pentaurelia TaxID=43138 RepID=A0A8S1XTC9_9CILI|nr:unnamed protein product [Paramecium pentaurelia]
MGSSCKTKPIRNHIHYNTYLCASTQLEKPIVQQQYSGDEIVYDSVSSCDYEKERSDTKSIVLRSPDVSLNSQTQNDSPLISKLHITSDDFVKLRNRNYLDFYSNERLLGVGSYGKVYLVRNKLTNQLRAMKQVKKKQSLACRKSLREMEILEKLDHPFIVKALEVFQDDQNYNMIIEFISGIDLQEDISNAKFTEEKASKIINQLLLAIGYIHHQGVVHRDIKPENILYQYNNGNDWIKLIDFGISTKIKKNKKLSSQLGSMYFMAPEIFQKDYGKQIDIWACGVTLFYMVHKRYPFIGKTDQEMKNAIISGHFTFDQGISPELKSLLSKMLQVNPNKRITAQQALHEDWFAKFNQGFKLNQSVILKLLNYHSTSLFEELIFSLITYYVQNSDDSGQAIQTFLCLDRDQDGQISKQELKQTIKSYNLNIENQSKLIDNLFSSLNKQQDDTLTYKEFLAASVASEKIQTRKCQKLCFQLIDADQDGKFSESDFCHLMGRKQVNLWHLLNPTDKSYITEEEFYGMFKQ